MPLHLFTESDRQAWDDYVLRHPRGTFFHLTGWKRVVERSFGHRSLYLIAENASASASGTGRLGEAATIAGVFPLFVLKSVLFGRSLVSVPFATYGGILADDQKTESALYKRAMELTGEQGLDYLEIRNQDHPLPELPTKDLYYSFKKEIFPGEDENLKAIPRKSRRMVRVAIESGLESAWGGEELLDEFYELVAYSYRGFGTPVFAKSFLRNLLNVFAETCGILIIRKDGAPLSGVLSFFFRNEVIPYYSGAYPDSHKHGANDFLYWSLMCIAVSRGCRIFDFGRSKKDTGPFHFKKHWGFEPRPLPYQYYLHRIKQLPNISPANPKYQRRIELWKKLPLWATKLIGPHIVKYIP